MLHRQNSVGVTFCSSPSCHKKGGSFHCVYAGIRTQCQGRQFFYTRELSARVASQCDRPCWCHAVHCEDVNVQIPELLLATVILTVLIGSAAGQ